MLLIEQFTHIALRIAIMSTSWSGDIFAFPASPKRCGKIPIFCTAPISRRINVPHGMIGAVSSLVFDQGGDASARGSHGKHSRQSFSLVREGFIEPNATAPPTSNRGRR